MNTPPSPSARRRGDSNLDIATECRQEAHQAFDREAIELECLQRRHLGVRHTEELRRGDLRQRASGERPDARPARGLLPLRGLWSLRMLPRSRHLPPIDGR